MHRQAVRGDDRGEVARPLEAEQERLDPGLELAGVERPRHDVVRAGLEEADPLLDVVACALTHMTGTAAIAGVARISRADVDRRLRAGRRRRG